MRMKGDWRSARVAAQGATSLVDQVEDLLGSDPDIAGRGTSLTDPCARRASVGWTARPRRRAIASREPLRARSAHIAQPPSIAACRQDADEFMEDVKHRTSPYSHHDTCGSLTGGDFGPSNGGYGAAMWNCPEGTLALLTRLRLTAANALEPLDKLARSEFSCSVVAAGDTFSGREAAWIRNPNRRRKPSNGGEAMSVPGRSDLGRALQERNTAAPIVWYVGV